MTVTDVNTLIEEIDRTRNSDPEHAHGCRDDLYRDVLRAVSCCRTVQVARNLAKAALKAEEIKLKWYATA